MLYEPYFLKKIHGSPWGITVVPRYLVDFELGEKLDMRSLMKYISFSSYTNFLMLQASPLVTRDILRIFTPAEKEELKD